MTMWHLMFQRPNFSEQQMQQLVADYANNQDFGGFAVKQLTLTHQTKQLFYLDFEFELSHAIDRGTFEQMQKFILLQTLGLQDAPMPVYYSVMAQSVRDLAIETHLYSSGEADIMYWRTPQ